MAKDVTPEEIPEPHVNSADLIFEIVGPYAQPKVIDALKQIIIMPQDLALLENFQIAVTSVSKNTPPTERGFLGRIVKTKNPVSENFADFTKSLDTKAQEMLGGYIGEDTRSAFATLANYLKNNHVKLTPALEKFAVLSSTQTVGGR